VKRLLLDQGLPRSTGALLENDGWDICHVSQIGMSRASDADILARARDDQRVCVTLDADFHALLATGGERAPSVIRIRREGLDAAALAALLQSVWPRIESALNEGAMVTLTETAVRIRRLPIGSQP
jgi:predicted nuclease of predicted toxin-antitoxin system